MSDRYTKKKTAERFSAILQGAMHKPTPHKDVPKKREKILKSDPNNISTKRGEKL